MSFGTLLSRLFKMPGLLKSPERRRKEEKVKPDEAITNEQEPPAAQKDAGTDEEKAKAQEPRPAPLPLDVEAKGQVEPEEPNPAQTPSTAVPIGGQAGAGEINSNPDSIENVIPADPTKVEELFTTPVQPEPEILSQQEVPTLGLDKSPDAKKDAALDKKSDDLADIFDDSDDDEDSILGELIASIPEVNMPEILHEAGAVKELMSELQQRGDVKAAQQDTVDSYTLRFVSKGGKDDGKKKK